MKPQAPTKQRKACSAAIMLEEDCIYVSLFVCDDDEFTRSGCCELVLSDLRNGSLSGCASSRCLLYIYPVHVDCLHIPEESQSAATVPEQHDTAATMSTNARPSRSFELKTEALFCN